MIKKETIKKWIPIQEIKRNGMIELKNGSIVKLLKVRPINFNLKTELEKQSILKSYHNFFKTSNCDMQIIIQSRKENLHNPISIIRDKMKQEQNKEVNKIAKQYIKYIQILNSQKMSSSKNFFIVIKDDLKKDENKYENREVCENREINLQEKYMKIKEALSYCGNQVTECSKQEMLEIIKNFLNRREKQQNSENF